MTEATLNLTFQRFFHQVLRGQVALILIRDAAGNYILSSKKAYPAGIYRMLGGGIEPGEDPHAAAARELQEETGLIALPSELLPLAKLQTEIDDQEQNHVSFTLYLYFYDCGAQLPIAADDVGQLITVSEAGFHQLLQRFTSLSTEIDPNFGFSWSDYGQLYRPVHLLALEELHKRQL